MQALLLALTLLVPAQRHQNMLFVDVRVNGGKPLSFLVNTAAPASMIDRRAKITGAADLDAGGRHVRVSKLIVEDFSWYEAAAGRRLDGVLGMDFLSQFVVELDYDSEIIRLHDPASFRYEGSGEGIALKVEKGRPRVVAMMNGEAREYVIDTGSADAITDTVFAGLARAKTLAIGRFAFANVNAGPGAPKISGELLHRFTVILDFARGRLILEANRHFGDAFLFETSGLELEQTAGGFRIVRVFPNTPAADAALAANDVIVAIDEQSPRAIGIDRAWRMFHEVREHQLRVRRGAKTMTVTLKLRTLL